MVKNPFAHIDWLVITCILIIRIINDTLDNFHGLFVTECEWNPPIVFWHFFFLEKIGPYRVSKCVNKCARTEKPCQVTNFDIGWHAGTSQIARDSKMLLKFLNSQSKRNFAFSKTVLNKFDFKRELCLFFSHFFHFPCNLRISTDSLSVTKNKIFKNLHYVLFIDFSYIWFYFMLECKLCKKILNIL